MMSRYFFDFRDGQRFMQDDEGVELADLQAVRSEVMNSLPAMAAGEILKNGDRFDFEMIVRDAAGAIMTANLSFALNRL
jgi:hypothetical protein